MPRVCCGHPNGQVELLCPQGPGPEMGLGGQGLTVTLTGSDATLPVLKVNTGLGQPCPHQRGRHSP